MRTALGSSCYTPIGKWGREKISKRTANLIYEAISKLSEKGGRREDVRRLLGLVK
ncbi:MAG: hypothetical protein QXI56_08210 [Candidatus Bathyarchaeia archaeon]